MNNISTLVQTVTDLESQWDHKKKHLSLEKNFIWTLIGNIIYAFSQWGILIILAKLGSSAMVGQYSLGLAVTGPIFLLCNLQLRGILATDAKGIFVFNDYLNLRLITTFAAVVISVLLGLVSYNGQTSLLIILIALIKGCESISDIFYGYQQKQERMDLIAKSLILKALLVLVFITVIVFLIKSVIVTILGKLFLWFGILILFDASKVMKLEYIKIRTYKNTLLDMFRLSWPMGIVMMLVSLNDSIPKYFLKFYTNESVLGIYSALAYLIVVGDMIVTALGQSSSAGLARFYVKQDINNYRRRIGKIILWGLLIGAGILGGSLILGKVVLAIAYGKEYAEQADVFLLLMIAGAIGYLSSFLGYGMTAARQFKIQLVIFLLAVIFNTISCYFLIPAYGMKGAATALIISKLVQLVLSSFVVVHLIRDGKNSMRFWKGKLWRIN